MWVPKFFVCVRKMTLRWYILFQILVPEAPVLHVVAASALKMYISQFITLFFISKPYILTVVMRQQAYTLNYNFKLDMYRYVLE